VPSALQVVARLPSQTGCPAGQITSSASPPPMPSPPLPIPSPAAHALAAAASAVVAPVPGPHAAETAARLAGDSRVLPAFPALPGRCRERSLGPLATRGRKRREGRADHHPVKFDHRQDATTEPSAVASGHPHASRRSRAAAALLGWSRTNARATPTAARVPPRGRVGVWRRCQRRRHNWRACG
jgi:hypothetical protein